MHLSDLLRISIPVTRFLGPEFTTSLDLIEIDITYACNLKCLNCNRSCSQAPTNEYITTEQFEKFITESISRNHQWKRIRLLGGEPYLHPYVSPLFDILIKYKNEFSPSTELEISTNGYGELVNQKIKETPPEIRVNNTHKNNTQQIQLEPFNKAPCDSSHHAFTDYRNACWITHECGIGLNMYGFYQCAVAAGIDRVMGLDIGLKTIPNSDEDMMDQKRKLCRFCGHFLSRQHTSSHLREPLEKEIITQSWSKAYRNYKVNKPKLTKY